MPDLLLELFSEEIPARMQRQAGEDLKRLVTGALVDAGITYEGAKAFATPRRIALTIAGLPVRQPDSREEKKGPRVGAPDAAVQGFLKSAGLTSLDQAKIESDPKKGEFYVAHIEKKGSETIQLLGQILPGIIKSFPWPKSMRWGKASAAPGSLRWVRPLRSILATFGAETEDTEIVPFDVDGLKAGDITYGHRFHAPGAIRVKRFDDYIAKLEAARVILDTDRRKQIIRGDAQTLCFAQGFELVEDDGLLEEVAGLVEWPVVLMGSFEEGFLDVPSEVIRATIRANQKCFVVKKTGGDLANRFLLTANIEADDGGKTIIAGNERVIRARLSDAKFFFETDKKVWNEDKELKRLERFKTVTFHEKLGSQHDRIERIAALAEALCPVTGADTALVARAAQLFKLDLQTEVVGEFPEVQGLMGRKYATLIGEHPSVAAACEEHYKPVGPTDSVPTDPVSVTLALADKLDTLVGFWAIDEKPTGSKDPYALRRAALGVIRLIVENGLRVGLEDVIQHAHASIYRREAFVCHYIKKNSEGFFFVPEWYRDAGPFTTEDGGLYYILEDIVYEDNEDIYIYKESFVSQNEVDNFYMQYLESNGNVVFDQRPAIESDCRKFLSLGSVCADLLSFFHDRLKVMLREKGARHDLVDAVLADTASPSPRQSGGEGTRVGGNAATPAPEGSPHPSPLPAASGGRGTTNDDLLLVVRRVEALASFLETEDGKSLLAGYKRAANILRAEEKKDGEGAFEAAANPALLREASEKALHAALSLSGEAASIAVERQDYEGAMRAMAALRAPVDAFFADVMVNADDAAIRKNRLAMLAAFRRVTRLVADFGRIAG